MATGFISIEGWLQTDHAQQHQPQQHVNHSNTLSLSAQLIIYMLFSHHSVSIVGSLRDREVACSASDRQGSNFESCVWRTVSSQSSHHPQEVLLAQFSLYVHKGGLKPDSFHFIFISHHSFRSGEVNHLF